MGKIIYPYRGYTNSAIKAKASIPNQEDMVLSGNNLDCSNISVTKVKNAIGSSATAVGSLCTSPSVNLWSNFAPVNRSIQGVGYDKNLVNAVDAAPYNLGDFAGYCHNPVVPGWVPNGKEQAEVPVGVNSGSKPVFQASVKIGEINYPGGVGVVLALFNQAGNLYGWGSTDLTIAQHEVDVTAETFDPLFADTSFTGKLYITDDLATFNQDHVVCRIPNVSDFLATAIIKQPTNLVVENGGCAITGASFNLANGTVSFSSLIPPTTGLIEVTAWLYNAVTNQVIGSYVMFSGMGYAGVNIGARTSQALGMSNVPNYGYRFNLVVEQSA